MNKKQNLIKVFLKEFIRIRGVFNWSAISFIGFLLSIKSFSFTEYFIPLLVFISTTFCIMSFTFSINNYYDIDSDKKNPKKIHWNAMASGKISKKTGAILNIIFVITPLVISFLYGYLVFLFSIMFITWMWMYSSPPFRLKGRPGFDIIWHFFAFFLIILWGSLIVGSIDLINWLVAISMGIFSCIAQVLNHINDYEYDKKSRTTTFAVWAGLDNTKKVLKVNISIHLVFLLPLIFLFLIKYFSTFVILIIGIIFAIVFAVYKKDENHSFTFYFSIIVGACIHFDCVIYNINLILGEQPMQMLSILNLIT